MWNEKVRSICGLLSSLEATDASGAAIPIDEAFDFLLNLAVDVKNNSKSVYFIGNGASASMASHFAADLAKNGRIHTQVFSDLALITAISNDLGFGQVFAEPLRRIGKPGDILVTISSSGESENIIKAIDEARRIGMKTVTLSAMDVDNRSRKFGDISMYVPAESYGDAESCHAAVLHYWIDLVVNS